MNHKGWTVHGAGILICSLYFSYARALNPIVTKKVIVTRDWRFLSSYGHWVTKVSDPSPAINGLGNTHLPVWVSYRPIPDITKLIGGHFGTRSLRYQPAIFDRSYVIAVSIRNGKKYFLEVTHSRDTRDQLFGRPCCRLWQSK